jgi:hypothetical protein
MTDEKPHNAGFDRSLARYGQTYADPAAAGDEATENRRPTFGQLVAEIARWTTLLELRRVDLAFGERFPGGEVSKKALERARGGAVEAEANLVAAISALDATIGVTPEELEQLGSQFSRSAAAAQEALDNAIDACLSDGLQARLESLAEELRRHGWVCQAPRDGL